MGQLIDGLHDYNLRFFENVPPPVLEGVYSGAASTTDYTYVATFTTINGVTIAGSELVVEDCSTLSANNTITLSATNVPAAARSIQFYRKVASDYKYIGQCSAAVNSLLDNGITPTSQEPPATDTSGRNSYRFIGYRYDRPLQRIDLIDQQSMTHRAIRDVSQSMHRTGDMVSGFSAKKTAEDAETSTWTMEGGRFVYDGGVIEVADAVLEIDRTATVYVGFNVSTSVVTYLDDPKLRNIDDGVANEYYNLPGADRIAVTAAWAQSEDVRDIAIPVYEFVDGQRNYVPRMIERSEWEKTMAQIIMDLAGPFVSSNFEVSVLDNTDTTKVDVVVGTGAGYPAGFFVDKRDEPTTIKGEPKPRTYETREDLILSQNYVTTGGWIRSIPGPFDLNGKVLRIQLQGGATHDVTFAANGMSAAQVVAAINAQLPAYLLAEPAQNLDNDGYKLVCDVTSTEGATTFEILAPFNKELYIYNTGADSAHALLFGITVASGEYLTRRPAGTRVYKLPFSYVKSVSSLAGKYVVVEQLTRGYGASETITGLIEVVGIAIAPNDEEDCEDNNFNVLRADYNYGNDTLTFTGASAPAQGANYWIKYVKSFSMTRGVRSLVRFIDLPVTKAATGDIDLLTIPSTSGGGHPGYRIREYTGETPGSPVTIPAGALRHLYAVHDIRSASSGGGVSYKSQAIVQYRNGPIAHDQCVVDWSEAGDPPEQPNPEATYYITCDFWYHDTEGDYISADSYDLYDRIPLAPNNSWPLRDCLDFRTTGRQIVNGFEMQCDVDYYLGRKDRVVLSADKRVWVQRGVPAVDPLLPREDPSYITLACLVYPPYTYKAANVTVKSVEPIRINQRGLREMQKRLDRLEYLVANDALAKDANISSVSQTSVGLYVDACTDVASANWGWNQNGVAHDMLLDKMNQCYTLPYDTDVVSLPLPTSSTGFVEKGGRLMLDYEEERIDFQPAANSKIRINSFPELTFRNGYVTLDPPSEQVINLEKGMEVNVDTTDKIITDYFNKIVEDESYGLTKYYYGPWRFSDDVRNREKGWVGVETTTPGAAGEGVPDILGNAITENLNNLGLTTTFDGYCALRNGGGEPCQVANPGLGYYWRANPLGIAMQNPQYSAWYNAAYYGRSISYAGAVDTGAWAGVGPLSDPWETVQAGDGSVPKRPVPIEMLRIEWAAIATALQRSYPGMYWGEDLAVESEVHKEWYQFEKKTYATTEGIYDLSFSQFANQVSISVTAKQLRPQADHGITVNGVAVNFTAAPGFSQGAHSMDGKTTVTTNASGEVQGTFTIPAGTKAGIVPIRVQHYAGPDYSVGCANFYSGNINGKIQTVNHVGDSFVAKYADYVERGQVHICYGDPLAQSFTLLEPTYISAVNIYFAEKPSGSGPPVRCEIRERTGNNISWKPIATSEPVAWASITTSPDGSVATKFTFTDIQLYGKDASPNNRAQYAIVLLTESNDYWVYIADAELAVSDLITGDEISGAFAHTHGGQLYTSANGEEWNSNPWKDLKFDLFKSNFEGVDPVYIEFGDIELTGIEAGAFALMVNETVRDNDVTWEYQLLTDGDGQTIDNPTWVMFDPAIDTFLSQTTTAVKLRVNVSRSGGVYRIDHKQAKIIVLSFKDSGNYVGNLISFPDELSYPDEAVVTLDIGAETTGASAVSGTSIAPFISTDGGLTWAEVLVDPNYTPISKGSVFQEFRFRTESIVTIDSITSEGSGAPVYVNVTSHRFGDGSKVYFTGTSALSTSILYMVEAVDSTKFKVKSYSNGAWTTVTSAQVVNETGQGKEVYTAQWDSTMLRIKGITNNKNRTPKFKAVRLFCNMNPDI